jgi:glycosyltransferase involved in cell wall biosynthesis
MPLVSVILPFNNLDDFINPAVDSILANSFKDLELVLVADGLDLHKATEFIPSTTDPRVSLIPNDGSGIVDALNTGWRNSRGELVARMDGDDLCNPRRLELQVRFLEKHPRTIAVGSNVDYICRHGNKLGTTSLPRIVPRSWIRKPFSSPMVHPTVMIRKSFSQATSPYREVCPGFQAEDFDLWNRVLRLGEIRNIKQRLLEYRLHANQISTLRAIEVQESAEIAVLLDIQECFGQGFQLRGSALGRKELIENLSDQVSVDSLTLLGIARLRIFYATQEALWMLTRIQRFLGWSVTAGSRPHPRVKPDTLSRVLSYFAFAWVAVTNLGNLLNVLQRSLNKCHDCQKETGH